MGTLEGVRPIRGPRPKKERASRELNPVEHRRQRLQHLLALVQLWITQEGLFLPDLELLVLPEAGKAYTSTDIH